MTSWLDIPSFKLRSNMSSDDIDRLEAKYPGFLQQLFDDEQGWIESRLRKRYAIPFAAPVPAIAIRWLVKIVTVLAYERRGWQPSSAENERIIKAADDAKAEVKEAADSKDGLFELPLRQDLPSSGGVSAGGPLGYAEASPYTAFDIQRDLGRGEDGGR